MISAAFAQHSLKTRITLSMLAIFLASLWALAFYVNRTLRADMEIQLSEQQLSTVVLLTRLRHQAVGGLLHPNLPEGKYIVASSA